MLKTYIVTIQYLEPCEGTTYTTAKNPKEAAEKIEKLFSQRQGIRVCDVVETPMTQLELDMEAHEDEQPAKGNMH